MNTPQHLANLMLLPWPELQTYQQVVADIVSLRTRVDTPPAREPVNPLPPVLGLEPRGLQERSPMREPKPGSMRGTIHDILRSAGKPMRRAEVIALVASKRGVPIDDALKAKVGDHLTNRHDPFVRKLAQGIYQFVPQMGGVLCF